MAAQPVCSVQWKCARLLKGPRVPPPLPLPPSLPHTTPAPHRPSLTLWPVGLVVAAAPPPPPFPWSDHLSCMRKRRAAAADGGAPELALAPACPAPEAVLAGLGAVSVTPPAFAGDVWALGCLTVLLGTGVSLAPEEAPPSELDLLAHFAAVRARCCPRLCAGPQGRCVPRTGGGGKEGECGRVCGHGCARV